MRTVRPIKGQTFSIRRVLASSKAVRADDGVEVYAAKPRTMILGNVGTVVKLIKGHAVTDDARKSDTVSVPRGDLVAWITAAGLPSLLDRFPESGEPTVPNDPETSAAFRDWLAEQAELTIGDSDAAAVADL